MSRGSLDPSDLIGVGIGKRISIGDRHKSISLVSGANNVYKTQCMVHGKWLIDASQFHLCPNAAAGRRIRMRPVVAGCG